MFSCGGGGGGGSSSSTPISPVSCSSLLAPLSYSLATCLYADTDQGYFNEPIIKVYIDGQPVKLLVDTGRSGLVVNSSAVNIPSSDIYSSYSFVDSFHDYHYLLSGTMAIATVCLNPSITNSCVLMKIGVLGSSDGLFSTSSEAQGVFGLASGFNFNSLDYSYPSYMIGYSYPTYLERKYGMNSYTISFSSLTNGYYSDVSSTTPIGYISFGTYNGNSNTLIPHNIYGASGRPRTIVVFPSSNSSTTSFTDYAVFDSSYRYNIFSPSVFQTEILNFNQGLDVGNCANQYGFPDSIVNGGLSITYSLQTNSGSFYSGSFTTEPSFSFCQAGIPFNLMEGVTLDNGGYPEIFGLPAMLGHTFTWVLANSGPYQGFVQYIGISP